MQRTSYDRVLGDNGKDMRRMMEEIFGPVVAVAPCDGEDEVTSWANDSAPSLAAAV